MNTLKNKLSFASIIVGAFTVAMLISTTTNAQTNPSNEPKLLGDYRISPQYFNEAKEREVMKKDGVPSVVIDKLIANRKQFFKDFKNVHKEDLSVLKDKSGNPPSVMACGDVGFENGWSTWAGAPGTTNGTTGIPTMSASVSPPVNTNSTTTCFTMTSGTGIDPCTPGTNPIGGGPGPTIPLVAPGFGNASLQLGCPQKTGCWVEQMTYNFVPTVQDTNFVYAYAVVLFDPGSSHSQTQRPFAEFLILAPNGDTVDCSYQKYVAPGGSGPLPGFFTAAGTGGCLGGTSTSYKPWTTVGVNLKQYVGQNLTIIITNVDCAQCGHYAHSYWDFKCGPVPLSLGCIGGTSTMTGPISDPNNPFTYQWYHNGVVVPGQTNQTYVVNPVQGDTFQLQVIQPSGCNFYLTYAPGLALPNFNFTGVCGNYIFKDSSFVSPQGSANITGYSWSFPGGSPATATTPTVNVTYPPGNYTASLTITASNGCSANVTHSVTTGGFPTAALTPSTPCLGNATSLTDGSVGLQGDPITAWNWSMPGGTPTSATSQNTATSYLTAGTHMVTLVVTSKNGCIDTVVQQVVVYNPPLANFSAPDSGCGVICNDYTDLSQPVDGNIVNWQWTFPGGTPTGSAAQNPINICYYTPGNYNATLLVTTNYGCKDTLTLPMISTVPGPKANFCVTPTMQPVTNPVFNFCDLWTSNVISWSWNFGDNDSDYVNTDPIHSYSATATQNDFYAFNVCLRVEDQYGCWDTICKIVELMPEFTFYIPNTFTPNGDFVNELFYGKGRGIKEYNIWLFDRWGNQIWDCHHEDKNTNWDNDATNPKQEGLPSFCKWDGKVVKGGVDMGGGSNQLAQEDVYVWKVRLVDIFDKKHMYIGHVNVVR